MMPPQKLHNGVPIPVFSFTFNASLDSWDKPPQTWIRDHSKTWDGIATGAVVFNAEGKLLLIQRAGHDSSPNKWEIPGGGADEDDPSILYGTARELWEESGLVARRFTHLITEGPGIEAGIRTFSNRYGTKWFSRFTFNVEVENCDAVKLDPNEHQAFIWATEQEVMDGKVGEADLDITHPEVRLIILEGFRLRKERALECY
jgi:8-oxo-dGTP pyrophosphatase MutT (NUDIX family)